MPEFDPLIIVNCRDRVSDLRKLVAWLEAAGHERVILLDNASTYQPLLEFYETCGHEVWWLPENLGSRALWLSDRVPDEPFIYTDPDVVPIEECPKDAAAFLKECLDRNPHSKAGLGLYLDDVPPFQSLDWERTIVSETPTAWTKGRLQDVRGFPIFDSLVDTTFCLYRRPTWTANSQARRGGQYLTAIRTGFPYQARHMPWYHLSEPSEEEQYYLARAIEGPSGSSWKEGRQ